MRLSDNARTVLERRYLAKDESGRVIETPEDLFRRVAANIAQAERQYAPEGKEAEAVARWEQAFLDLMVSLRFLPNSPTLGNAGRPLQQLSACFVLPVEDSIAGIFETVKETALIHQSGGGTGFSFSRLRPAGDVVQSTGGVASGPVSFMKVFDGATEAIKQGGTRRGANMAILDVRHPDIEAFINVKADMVTLTNFNISVAVDEAFMRAVEAGEDYDLVNPRTGQAVGRRNARAIFDQIVANAWANGDPGLVFLDRINKDNPTPKLGRIEATNPCGEQPLLPYESCNLGSINLSKFLRAGRERAPSGLARAPVEEIARAIDWEALSGTIATAVRFLDDVIDMNAYPIPEIERMTRLTRKIGLGVMGWADLLFMLGVPYDSEAALTLGEKVMGFIREHADAASEALAAERGTFPAWEDSIYGPAGRNRPLRNATRTTVAPTGTLSIIADCSGGIEPAFALAFIRQHYLDPSRPSQPVRMTEVNRVFEEAARAAGFWSESLVRALAEGVSLQERDDVPDWAKEVFVTAHEVEPEWHVRMQAAFQRHTDNAVSKTINFPRDATLEDVARAYLLAYHEGCKGITIYRDGSRAGQVLSHAVKSDADAALEAPPADVERGLHRRHMPAERRSITHKFRVGEQEGFVTVGLFDDGTPGEIFVTISKEGSTIRGLMDSVAMLTSYSLQYGVPLRTLVDKFKGVHFEPAGFTANPEIPQASSIVDYIFRWLELKFLQKEDRAAARSGGQAGGASGPARGQASPSPDIATGLLCPDCGNQLVFAEGCLICRSCGYNKCG
ncbi:MAG TPA: vitamin B12-dependent ribonucleotide reductase [Dehalococcoidia bacterium]|nr:vitamin B12-dependent ribonucleotide reductase [Dehalococcoidia bacterium]